MSNDYHGYYGTGSRLLEWLIVIGLFASILVVVPAAIWTLGVIGGVLGMH